jgi:hypothetical protein
MPDELESLHKTVLRTQAMYVALESLCLALFSHAPDRDAVLQRYKDQQESLATKMLFDGQLTDDPLSEIQDAHARLLALIANIRS